MVAAPQRALVAYGVALGVALSYVCRRLAREIRHSLRARAAAQYFTMQNRLSLVATSRKPAPLRDLLPRTSAAGVVAMAGGLPDASLFPVKAYALTLADGSTITVDSPELVYKAQQYMHDASPGLGVVGYKPLLEWLRAHIVQQHAPPYEGWDVCLSTGNADGFQRAWETLLDPGDTMLCDELDFSFSTSQLSAWVGAKGLHVEALAFAPATGDQASALRALLGSWRLQRPSRRFPKALFTISAFQNPTGRSRTRDEAAAVYSVCAEYGIVIIEDDPYRLLAFGDPLDETAPLPGCQAAGGGEASLPVSFLSLDTDGRVIRCDTFSKWMNPGLRCGWLTAPRAVLQKLAQGAGPSLGVSSATQVLLHAIFEHWGPQGIDAHVRRVQAAYRRRCAVALRAAEEHLAGLARWEAPRGGMFLWIELLGVGDSLELLDEMEAEKVVVCPGAYFHHAGVSAESRSPYVRVSFSSAPEESLVIGFKRLGAVLRRRQAAKRGEAWEG